jgi:hypothetical protein
MPLLPKLFKAATVPSSARTTLSGRDRTPLLGRAALVSMGGALLLFASFALVNVGFLSRGISADTPVYQRYGDKVLDGRVPYRDFALEYPPGALPVFVAPAVRAHHEPERSYRYWFETLMLVCAFWLLGVVMMTLQKLGASRRRRACVAGFVALSPLLIGSVAPTHFDYWPALLTSVALALLTADRRSAFAVLGIAVTAKIYPIVLLPVGLLFVLKRRGVREALLSLGLFVAACSAVILPFAITAHEGLVASVRRQAERPLQVESLGSALLLAADHAGAYSATVVKSAGSYNLVGPLADAVASVQTVLVAFALVLVWGLFARGGTELDRLFAASGASLTAFVAFSKVLSPQFLLWLVPVVPLVAGRSGTIATAVLAAALVLTQAFFPRHYWSVVAGGDATWLVLVRDVVLLVLFAVLVHALARRNASPDREGIPGR